MFTSMKQLEASVRLSIQIADRIDTLATTWDQAAPTDNLFLQRPYLRILEDSPPTGMQFRYAVVHLDQQPVAVIYTQLLLFKGADSIRYHQSVEPSRCFFPNLRPIL